MGISQHQVVKHPYAERTFDNNRVNTIPIFLKREKFIAARSVGKS